MSNEAFLSTFDFPQPPLFFQWKPMEPHVLSSLRGAKIFSSSAWMPFVSVLSYVLSMSEPGWTTPRLPPRPSMPLKGMNLNAVAFSQGKVPVEFSMGVHAGSTLIFSVFTSVGLSMSSLHVSWLYLAR